MTHRVILKRAFLQDQTGAMGDFVRDLTAKYMDFYSRNQGLDGCPLHDPLAVGLVIRPAFGLKEQFHVEVGTSDAPAPLQGVTIADYRPTRLFKDRMKALTWVTLKVDAGRFLDFFSRTVFEG